MKRLDLNQPEFVDFYLPFGGKLSSENRWVKLAQIVPWEEVEECYQKSLKNNGMGAPPLSGRIAFGAQVIKERLGISDEETVEQIIENPYLQYFLGLSEYREEQLFTPSMMVHFRSRFNQEDYQRINLEIIQQAIGTKESAQDDDDSSEPPANSGKLLVDATCTPADITFPTDLKLLNEAREKSEKYIDILHAPFTAQSKKPRTYRQKARKNYLAVAKQKRAGAKKIRKAIGQQLRYLRRNLAHIDKFLDRGVSLGLLSAYELRGLQVIHTLYLQQLFMYSQRTHSVPDRIVNISQPHVRPIVRGKAGKKVEFGAKISISHFLGGYVTLDKLSWSSYNESGDLMEQIESYKKRFGSYPESVHADTIYRTRENRRYCKERNIRLSGKPLGRPKKQTSENKEELKAQRQQIYQDEVDRIPVEGKFGEAKRKGTLQRVMAKLAHTSESIIHMGIIVLNLDKYLREVFIWLMHLLIFDSCGRKHHLVRLH